MDYTSQFQFTGGQPYQSFMSIPPLTPSNSQYAASEDFNATASPPGGFDGIAGNDQFHGFDYSSNLHNPSQHNPSLREPSSPPNGVPFSNQQARPQRAGSQLRHPHQHQHRPANGNFNGGVANVDTATDDGSLPRTGSEDDESMTPAQSRRKAQNRAAQRAFRERKEKHVKDLEAKLASLEAAQQHASTENERLKRDLQKMSTENEILRATSALNNGYTGSHSPEPMTTGPMKYNPTDFYSHVLQNHQNKIPSHRVVTSDDGERLLAAGATWDFIINHDLYKQGLVDIGDLSERLKDCARCDGQGPVFSEQSILKAMKESVASGSDDLL